MVKKLKKNSKKNFGWTAPGKVGHHSNRKGPISQERIARAFPRGAVGREVQVVSFINGMIGRGANSLELGGGIYIFFSGSVCDRAKNRLDLMQFCGNLREETRL